MTIPRNTPEDQQGLWQSAEAAEAWRRTAATRMQLLGPATERMLVLANITEGCHVLDIAAGTGDQTILAAWRVEPRGRVVATDISPNMLAVAAEQAQQAGLSNVTTQVLEAQHLDFPAETFDAVISRQGLMFIANLPQALSRIWQVLKPGGILAATVWSAPERNPVFALPFAIARRYAGLPEMAAGGPGLFALSTPELLTDALHAAGFQDITVEAIPLQYEYPSAAAFMDARKETAGPLLTMIERLSPADRERVWTEIAAALRRFEGPQGFAAPGEILLVRGSKGRAPGSE
jgi:ubiquinone/menaquinone biosynthesis C-methylase UbiE